MFQVGENRIVPESIKRDGVCGEEITGRGFESKPLLEGMVSVGRRGKFLLFEDDGADRAEGTVEEEGADFKGVGIVKKDGEHIGFGELVGVGAVAGIDDTEVAGGGERKRNGVGEGDEIREVKRHFGGGDVVINVEGVKPGEGVVEAEEEIVEVFAFGSSPSNFSEGEGTRVSPVLDEVWGVEVLGPEVGLDAEDMVSFGGEARRDGVVAIDGVKGGTAADGEGLDEGLSFVTVDVEAFGAGCHDDVMALQGSINTTLLAPP